ncbi:Sec34-like family-domain-containing protein [Gilbertella persicaria]|uniref:Sec34-like family-domain-containing protein n=1 Tax=Gilbertella persicaria TaxID=101096 RepID=UPI0022202851|nr:Sec34-like family-domain-containing protein [Gilbertella persicaria]KAI8090069.1 Sec34-like family-domain-containing protein [Gilbertella persicaria]
MEKGQEDVYRNHVLIVEMYQKACDDFLTDLEATRQLFHESEKDYAFVDSRTRSVQTACETLLEEQDRLTQLADGLASRLAYFNQLEPIAKLFNSPGDDICLNSEFIPMLGKLDECIEYMQQHRDYRDSELYLMRFRQCMTRGITLIKMYVVSTIKTLGYDAYKQVNAKETTIGKQLTMYYVKFKTMASTIKSLTTQVDKRHEHKEYQSLYEDMLYAYFQTRQQLLSPLISKKIQQLNPNDKDLLGFAKNGCAFMMSLCSDEFNLFYNFFHLSGEQELYHYLDLLTSHLYDYLRPRIIHENDIGTLSELCNVFLMYVMQDENDFVVGIIDDRNEVKFGHLIQNILEDTQARLVFRAQMFIQSDIQNYQTKPQDFEIVRSKPKTEEDKKTSVVLDPNVSTTATLAVTSEDASDTQSIQSNRSNLLSEGNDSSSGWFPTLQKTLWLLSKLYRSVQTSVFEDLAQEAVSLCNDSLLKASETVLTLKSRLDSELFLIKNLLVLKEQLAPFEANLVHAGKTLDFSHVTDSLSSFQQQKSLLFNPNALIGLAQRGMPRVVEVSLDSRREIDFQIKNVCEKFINNCVDSSVEPLTAFLIKLSTILPPEISLQSSEGGDFSIQRLGQDNVHEAVDQFMEAVEERIRFVTRKLKEYVNDAKMEQILMKPIETSIIEQYKSFLTRVEIESKEGGRIDKLERQPMSVESVAVSISQLKYQ